MENEMDTLIEERNQLMQAAFDEYDARECASHSSRRMPPATADREYAAFCAAHPEVEIEIDARRRAQSEVTCAAYMRGEIGD